MGERRVRSWCVGTYVVIHNSTALDQQGGVVGELGFVDIGAVWQMGAIVDIPVLADVAEPMDEGESPLREFGISRVVEIAGQAGPDVEIASVGNG